MKIKDNLISSYKGNLVLGSVSHPNGSMSKSGQDLPRNPVAPIFFAAAKELCTACKRKYGISSYLLDNKQIQAEENNENVKKQDKVENICSVYLDTEKCELTSFQLSQSSPVILYILT